MTTLPDAPALTHRGCGADLMAYAERARRAVPLYERLYGGTTEALRWGELPFVTKREMRAGFPGNFLREGADVETLVERGEVELERTSGTSGDRLELILGAGWWADQEARALRLNPRVRALLDEHPRPRRAVLAAPGCTQTACYLEHPTMAERLQGETLPLSLTRFPWLASDEDWARVAAELEAWQPLLLDTDPVYAAAFARYCLRTGRRFASLRFVLASYEFVGGVHRRRMQEAWGVPVYDLYGATETGHLLMEDADGRMRPSEQTACLELVDTDPDGIGELVVTTLTNDYMPLIRYRIGDLAERRAGPAGWEYRVHGRARDALRGADGRRVTTRQVDESVSPCQGLWHYHLSESAGGALTLRYLADAPLAGAELEGLQRRLGGLFGAGQVALRRVEAFTGEASGKFRLTQPRAEAL